MTDLLIFNQRHDSADEISTTLTLPFDLRQKSRLRVKLDDGREAGLMLDRGHILRGGDILRADDGTVIAIRAAAEAVSTATHESPAELARVAYHLGNRHVALQVGDGWLRFLADHVLDAMVISLGMQISHEQAPFEPESGAYHSHADSQAGSHSHSHNQSHEHGHDHSHDHSRGPLHHHNVST